MTAPSDTTLGTVTTPGPLETIRVTVDPFDALACAAGKVAITLPRATVAEGCGRWGDGKPARVRIAAAAGSLWPTTLGTVRVEEPSSRKAAMAAPTTTTVASTHGQARPRRPTGSGRVMRAPRGPAS